MEAKEAATRPEALTLRRKLWLRILHHASDSSNYQQLADLVNESPDIDISDILPYLADSTPLGSLKKQFELYISEWEKQVRFDCNEMDAFKESKEACKKEVKRTEDISVELSVSQVCAICGLRAASEVCRRICLRTRVGLDTGR